MPQIAGVEFEERELEAIRIAKYYESTGAPGLPNHLFMVVIAKMAKIIERDNTFMTDQWQSGK